MNAAEPLEIDRTGSGLMIVSKLLIAYTEWIKEKAAGTTKRRAKKIKRG
jgi:hypothetical protein